MIFYFIYFSLAITFRPAFEQAFRESRMAASSGIGFLAVIKPFEVYVFFARMGSRIYEPETG